MRERIYQLSIHSTSELDFLNAATMITRMQNGFVKAIFAILIFALGFLSLFIVFAHTFGWLKIEASPDGFRYGYLKFSKSKITCWLDLPAVQKDRCIYEENYNLTY